MDRMGQGQTGSCNLGYGIVGSKGSIQGIPCVEQPQNTTGSSGSRRLFSRPASEQRSLHYDADLVADDQWPLIATRNHSEPSLD